MIKHYILTLKEGKQLLAYGVNRRLGESFYSAEGLEYVYEHKVAKKQEVSKHEFGEKLKALRIN